MGEEDIPPPQDGKDEKKSPGEHDKDQSAKEESKKERKGGMNVLQPHHRDVPEEKDQKEEDQAGHDQKTDKDSLFRFGFQEILRKKIIRNVKIQSSNEFQMSKIIELRKSNETCFSDARLG